jgi:hypothetical protein
MPAADHVTRTFSLVNSAMDLSIILTMSWGQFLSFVAFPAVPFLLSLLLCPPTPNQGRLRSKVTFASNYIQRDQAIGFGIAQPKRKDIDEQDPMVKEEG